MDVGGVEWEGESREQFGCEGEDGEERHAIRREDKGGSIG